MLWEVREREREREVHWNRWVHEVSQRLSQSITRNGNVGDFVHDLRTDKRFSMRRDKRGRETMRCDVISFVVRFC